jgi:hypothetical protein
MAIMKKLLILLLFIPYLGFSQIKISALTEATTLNANDWFMAVQGGTTKKVAFYRFSYNQDSTALQITDSLAFYVQKTELSDSLLNYILRTELNDSLANYTSLDSLTYYMKTIDVRNAISDSIAGISSVSLGADNQIPFMNSAGTNYEYSTRLTWDGSIFRVGTSSDKSTRIGIDAGYSDHGSSNTFIGYIAGYQNSTGAYNTFLGTNAGAQTTTGSHNLFMGYNSGWANVTGARNTMIGNLTNYDGSSNGNDNIYIGYMSGYESVGSGNLFIGDSSGAYNTASNKLYIENSPSTTPLIWGDFANDSVRINGVLDVTENLTVDTITANYFNLTGVMNIAKAEVNYIDTAQTTIITLPANAVIWNVEVEVVQGFNDTGLNRLYVGITGDYTKYTYGGLGGEDYIDVMDAIWAHGRNLPDRLAASTNIIFTYDGENSDATQGQAFVYIHYSLH